MIELKDVTKEYSKGIAALNGISLTIEQGEFVFIVGEWVGKIDFDSFADERAGSNIRNNYCYG